jgi:hypothetical protein
MRLSVTFIENSPGALNRIQTNEVQEWRDNGHNRENLDLNAVNHLNYDEKARRADRLFYKDIKKFGI